MPAADAPITLSARHKPRPPHSSTQLPLCTASHDVPHIASLLLGSVAAVTNLTRSANVSSYSGEQSKSVPLFFLFSCSFLRYISTLHAPANRLRVHRTTVFCTGSATETNIRLRAEITRVDVEQFPTNFGNESISACAPPCTGMCLCPIDSSLLARHLLGPESTNSSRKRETARSKQRN